MKSTQKNMKWSERSNTEKLEHMNDHLFKALDALEDANDEMRWLASEYVAIRKCNTDFCRAVVDIRERIMDLESDISDFTDNYSLQITIDNENMHAKNTKKIGEK